MSAAAERQAEDCGTRIGIPMRCAEPGEGGDDLDAAAVGHRTGERLAVRRGSYQAELVAQPLDHPPGNEQRAFERILALPIDLPGDRREQPIAR